MIARIGGSLLAACLCTLPVTGSEPDDLVSRVRRHTSVLAADELGGRGNGTPGLEAAAEYLVRQFEAIGLEPDRSGDHRQEFELPDGAGRAANVVGIVRAASPTAESVVVTAHYDGLGRGEPDETGDAIYNGALDNAIGVGALIELARRYARRVDLPRHLVFVATAGEEIGKLGMRRYLAEPPFPVDGIVMGLNIDGLNVYGVAADAHILPRSGIGYRGEIASLAASMGLEDTTPEWVDDMDRAFDTAELLARGVPAVTVWWGARFVGLTPEQTRAAQQEIFRRHHRPSDEIGDHWRWDGVAQHVELYARLIDHYLSVSERPRVLELERFR